jgi:uncharacterized membrane protein YgdD (TMEM256/DUF423 family)
MHRFYLRLGALTGAFAVIFGAFGAHYLKTILGEESIVSFQTGVQYQFYHAFAIIVTGLLVKRYHSKWIIQAGRLFMAGIVLFSGSIYLLTILKGTGEEDLGALALVTPLGGLLFIAGWICLAIGVPTHSHKHESKEE